MQKITPFLWYDGKAEEAAKLYTSIFKNSKIISTMYYGEGSPAPAGSVMSVTSEIEGQQLVAFNGGPHFKFTPAISLFVNCYSQAEVDVLWEKLSEGGRKDRCGWLQDKYGLSWQIIPDSLGRMLQDSKSGNSKRVMESMLKMDKLDVGVLERAYQE